LEYMVSKEYMKLDLDPLKNWVNETDELSNASLKRQIEKKSNPILKAALKWSELVNDKISKLSSDKKMAFSEVQKTLETLQKFADIVIVSSANREAVIEEFRYNRLLPLVNGILTQECGTKTECIKSLLTRGYDYDSVIMVGDAPGDFEAAKNNKILYYPINVKGENEAWKNLRENTLIDILEKNYRNNKMLQYEEKYFENLKQNK
jgi:phosphoglycolate phosphatase-like HAD superfamily hydrolase